MSVRLWLGPWEEVTQNGLTFKRARAAQYCTSGHRALLPLNSDGSMASPWVIIAGAASDWTAAESDALIDDLFAGDLPSSINTLSELRTFLRTRTIADVPLARRNDITAVLDEYGVVRSDFVGSTPLIRVFQRVFSTLWELDFNFPGGFLD